MSVVSTSVNRAYLDGEFDLLYFDFFHLKKYEMLLIINYSIHVNVPETLKPSLQKILFLEKKSLFVKFSFCCGNILTRLKNQLCN